MYGLDTIKSYSYRIDVGSERLICILQSLILCCQLLISCSHSIHVGIQLST
jgi:hypothetical protein